MAIKGKMPAAESEHGQQAALISWWNMAHGKKEYAPLLFAIPNGGARDAVTGARLKAEGARRGVPDLFLALPRGGYAGLWLEMKTARGRLSEDQRLMLDLLAHAGYAACVARGFNQAADIIEAYLAGETVGETYGASAEK